ncbi:hypothetical protein IID10_09010 [candidate division KSB1 bacterium]|nr:hypothetical protein [candidate division KSB1 bacterium]
MRKASGFTLPSPSLDTWLCRNPVKTTGAIEQQADDYIVNGKRGQQ